MVFFTCNACGQSIKKNRVEKHWKSECPRCEVLSCMDCGKDFYGDEYMTHTSCVSEAEKYQGDLFRGEKGGQSKGEKRQQEWLERIRQSVSIGNTSSKIGQLLTRISEYPNIPRKKAKFENFVKNSINVRDQTTLNKLWEAFSKAIKPPATPTASTDEKIAQDRSDKNGDSSDTSKKDKVARTKNGAKKEEEKEGDDDDSIPLLQGDSPDNALKKKKKKKTKDKQDNETVTNGSSSAPLESGKASHKTKKKRKLEEGDGEVEEMDTSKSKKKKRMKLEVDSDTGGAAVMEIAAATGKKKKKKAKESDYLVIANDHVDGDDSPLELEGKIIESTEDNSQKKKSKKAKKHKHSDSSPLLL